MLPVAYLNCFQCSFGVCARCVLKQPAGTSKSSTSTPQNKETALQRLISAPKGNLDYKACESFMLHVFWETPSPVMAHKLLSALQQCATATHRDTPCVPTYFFRISDIDASLCSPAKKTAGEHPALLAANRKIQMGVPVPAVHADLKRRGLDPSLLSLDPASELPLELQTCPVMVECTELYLDERAFYQHAGSRDYLAAYGTVMQPELMNTPARTVGLGTPPASVVERVLDPMLHQIAVPNGKGCVIWQCPKMTETAVFLSLDIPANGKANDILASLPPSLLERCSSLVSFPHPLRDDTARVLCVLTSLPNPQLLACIAALNPVRGEAHVESGIAERLHDLLAQVGLGFVTVNATEAVGYVLHDKATCLQAK